MGWKGAVRSIQAANNRARREQEKAERATVRSLSQIDRNADQVLKIANSLEDRLKRDVIKALSLSYSHSSGFSAEPFEINTDIFSGSISLLPDNSDNLSGKHFKPNSFDTITSSVKPLAVLLCQWATVVAVEASNTDPDFSMNTNWVKKSDPQNSSIFILDTVNSEYYYPTSSSLKGSLVPGHPKIGLIAFEPFVSPIDSFQLHFSNVPMQKGSGGKQTFHFTYKSNDIKQDILGAVNKRPISAEIDELLSHKVDELRNSVLKRNSGCLVTLVTGITFMTTYLSKLSTG